MLGEEKKQGCIGAITAGPNVTKEAPFEAPERPKDYGCNFRVASVIHGTFHVRSRKYLQKSVVKAVVQNNGRIRLKLGGPKATIGGHVPLG